MMHAGFVEGCFVTVAADRDTISAMFEWMMRPPYCFDVRGTGGWTDGMHHTWGGFLRTAEAERLREWLRERGVSCGTAEPTWLVRRARAEVERAASDADGSSGGGRE